jgi:hypothetical protein
MAGAYDIMIHMSLEDEISGALIGIAGHLTGLEGQIGKIQKLWEDMGNASKIAIGGIAAMAGGTEIIKGLNDLAEASERLVAAQNKLAQGGVNAFTISNVTDSAFNDVTGKVPTADAADAVRTFGELRSVFGSDKSAMDHVPMSLKLDFLASQTAGHTVEGEGFKLWRALEMRGDLMTNPEGEEKLANLMAQDITGSNGKVTADTFQSMAKQAKSSWMHLSPQFITGAGAALAGDIGGDRAGTGLDAFYRGITGQTMLSNQQVEGYEKLGLLDPANAHKQKGGQFSIDPDAIKGTSLALTDPDIWAKTILQPALEKAAGGDSAMEASLIGKIGRNSGMVAMLSKFTDPGFQEQFRKDQEIWRGSQGIDQAYDTAINGDRSMVKGPGGRVSEQASADKSNHSIADYAANMEALHKQFSSLMEAIGGPVSQMLIPQIKGLTDMLNNAAAAAAAHPEAVKNLEKLAEGLGAVMIVLGAMATAGGVAALIGLAPVAATVAGGITAVSLALGALAAINFGGLTNGLHTIEDAVGRLMGFLGITHGDVPHQDPHGAAPTRDPRSPQVGPQMYMSSSTHPLAGVASPSVTISSPVTAPLSGTMTNNITINNAGLLSEVKQVVQSEIKGAFSGIMSMLKSGSGNSSAGFDGRAAPSTPDASIMHGSH